MTSLRYITIALVLIGCASLTQAQSSPNPLNLTFTTIDVPGTVITNVEGINTSGVMVGNYATTSNGMAHGFIYDAGNFTEFDYPNADSTLPFGINDSGIISGSAYIRNSTAALSFLYDGTTFTTVRAPGDSATLARGINNAGVMVGGDGLTLSGTKGFALSGTQFKTVSPPGVYVYVFGDGINNLNQVVGSDDNSSFFYSNGRFKVISFPGASQTQAWGINDSGIIVGWYSGESFTGFALRNGKYLSITYPGALYTFASGINKDGQIVGSYTLDQQTYHGFVTSPITAETFEKPDCCVTNNK
jgi:probable HAF family extracellular repeat protein